MTVEALDRAEIDLAEISYGTMAWATNIFRGDCPVRLAMRVNPVLKQRSHLGRAMWMITNRHRILRTLKPYRDAYNAAAAAVLGRGLGLAVVPVGGIVSRAAADHCMRTPGLPAVALCRALVHDSRFARALLDGGPCVSSCTRCNRCAILSDTPHPLQCAQTVKQPSSIGCQLNR